MKILLDECVDARLAREITGHDVRTVPQMGWAGVKNGILLGLCTTDAASRHGSAVAFAESRKTSTPAGKMAGLVEMPNLLPMML